MTDDQKAEALVKEVQAERAHTGNPWNSPTILNEALCRAIEQHEAFKQEVSDALVDSWYHNASGKLLERFIISKPDPLVEAIGEAMQEHEVYSKYELTVSLRAALEARGLEIRSKTDD